VVVRDTSKVLRLIEIETGRILARLESPDQHEVGWATFSPDGSRLVVTTHEPPCAHVWDLRAIRRRLAGMGLYWDAPSLPDLDIPSGDSGDAPPLKAEVDFGPLRRTVELYNSHLEQYTVPAEELIARHTGRLKAHPYDPDSLHQRGHALLRSGRFEQALADFAGASARRPLDAHLRAYRGVCLFNLQRYALALDQLETAFQADPETVRAISNLQPLVNNRAWELATGAGPRRDPALAARLAAFAVALSPDESVSLNTLGVALYRAGQYAEAIATLERSLAASKGESDAFDLFFLAMTRRQLGQIARARADFESAVQWRRNHSNLPAQWSAELDAFQAEAEAALTTPADELPPDVWAPR
jgi:tetratricopeptide (TPR) repeat protein